MSTPGVDPYREDLLVRLAAADNAWGHAVGDPPHERQYIEWLADKVCALQPAFHAFDEWAVRCADGTVVEQDTEQEARDFAAMIDPTGTTTEVVHRMLIRTAWVAAETVADRATRKAA
jgi:hypothetical protein